MNEIDLLFCLETLDKNKEEYLLLIKALERKIENHRTEIMGINIERDLILEKLTIIKNNRL